MEFHKDFLPSTTQKFGVPSEKKNCCNFIVLAFIWKTFVFRRKKTEQLLVQCVACMSIDFSVPQIMLVYFEETNKNSSNL